MHKLPDNWKDFTVKSGDKKGLSSWRGYQQAGRAKNTPGDKSVDMFLRTLKSAQWTRESMLRLLSLSRDPILSAQEIARILSHEFSGEFSHSSVLGRLTALREAELGVRKVSWGRPPKDPGAGRHISVTHREKS